MIRYFRAGRRVAARDVPADVRIRLAAYLYAGCDEVVTHGDWSARVEREPARPGDRHIAERPPRVRIPAAVWARAQAEAARRGVTARQVVAEALARVGE